MRLLVVVTSLALTSCAGVVVQTGHESASDGPALDDVAWLVGSWQAAVDEHGCTYQEEWHRESEILLSGHASESCPATMTEREPFDEDLHLQMEARGLVYVASPSGQVRTEFDLTSGDAHGFVAENPDHDFPTRIEYRRTDTGIDAIVSGPGRSFTLSMHAAPN